MKARFHISRPWYSLQMTSVTQPSRFLQDFLYISDERHTIQCACVNLFVCSCVPRLQPYQTGVKKVNQFNTHQFISYYLSTKVVRPNPSHQYIISQLCRKVMKPLKHLLNCACTFCIKTYSLQSVGVGWCVIVAFERGPSRPGYPPPHLPLHSCPVLSGSRLNCCQHFVKRHDTSCNCLKPVMSVCVPHRSHCVIKQRYWVFLDGVLFRMEVPLPRAIVSGCIGQLILGTCCLAALSFVLLLVIILHDYKIVGDLCDFRSVKKKNCCEKITKNKY